MAGLLLMVATLASPVNAVSHGWAHHEHESAHLVARTVPTAPETASLSATDDDHAHPDVVTVIRNESRTAALPVTHVVTVLDVKIGESGNRRAGATRTRLPGDPWPGPPPRLRAPPIA